ADFQAVGDAAETNLTKSQHTLTDFGKSMADSFGPAAQAGVTSWYDVWYENQYRMKDVGTSYVDAFTQGLVSDESQLSATAQQLQDILKNGMTPDELATEAEGRKYIKLVERGIRSQKIGAKAAAQDAAVAAIKAIVDAADGTPNTKGLRAI